MSNQQDKANILWRGRRIALIQKGEHLLVAFPLLNLHRMLIAINLILVGSLIPAFFLDNGLWVAFTTIALGLIIMGLAWLTQVRKSRKAPFLDIDTTSSQWEIPDQELCFHQSAIVQLEYQYGWKAGFLADDQPERWATASPNLSGHTMTRLALITREEDITEQWQIVRCEPFNCPTDGEAWSNLIRLGEALEKETGITFISDEEIQIPESLRRTRPMPRPSDKEDANRPASRPSQNDEPDRLVSEK